MNLINKKYILPHYKILIFVQDESLINLSKEFYELLFFFFFFFFFSSGSSHLPKSKTIILEPALKPHNLKKWGNLLPFFFEKQHQHHHPQKINGKTPIIKMAQTGAFYRAFKAASKAKMESESLAGSKRGCHSTSTLTTSVRKIYNKAYYKSFGF